MTRTEMVLGEPAVIPAGMLRGRVGATRWTGTGSTAVPEDVGAAATGVGDVPEAAAGATVGGGKDGAEAAGDVLTNRRCFRLRRRSNRFRSRCGRRLRRRRIRR